MSSLEGRVRGALRATADEITSSDVPPLATQLTFSLNDSAHPVAPTGNSRPGSRLRHRGLRPRGLRPRGLRHSGLRRWGAPLAAAVAVLAVVAIGLGSSLIVGSGTGHARSAHPGAAASSGTVPASRPAATTPPYGTVADLTQGLVDEFLTASGSQYAAGWEFMARVVGPAEDTILARCLTAHGFPTKHVSGSGAAKFAEVWDLYEFPDLNAIAKAGAMPSGETVGGQATWPHGYQAALLDCTRPASDPFSAMSDYASTLGNPFVRTVLGIQAAAPRVRATIPALRACASRYGWPKDSTGYHRPLNSFGDFVTWVSTFLDGPMSRGASATTMQALRKHWGPIFVECARPTVSVMEQLQLAAQRSFVAAHRTQLAHLVSLAVAAFDQAH